MFVFPSTDLNPVIFIIFVTDIINFILLCNICVELQYYGAYLHLCLTCRSTSKVERATM